MCTRITIRCIANGVQFFRESFWWTFFVIFLQLQEKMSEVQQQLQELKSHLDGDQGNLEERQNLMDKVEALKEEFRELLGELRRKRMSHGGTVLSDDVSRDKKGIKEWHLELLFLVLFFFSKCGIS